MTQDDRQHYFYCSVATQCRCFAVRSVAVFAMLVAFSSSHATSLAHSNRLKPLFKRTPDAFLQVEQDLWKKKKNNQQQYTHILGSDDSGGGCIAGPICVATVCLLRSTTTTTGSTSPQPPPEEGPYHDNPHWIPGVQDSKKLAPTVLQTIYDTILRHPEHFAYSIAVRSNECIDEMGLHETCMDAFAESIQRLAEQVQQQQQSTETQQCCSFYSIVDGKSSPMPLRNHDTITSRPWKHGDEMVYTVALASIVARVKRQELMDKVSQPFPQYQFETHGGYPTRLHLQSLHQYGPCILHRKSTKPVQSRGDFLQQSSTAMIFLLLTSLGMTPQSSQAMTIDLKTGVSFPDVGEIEAAIPSDWKDVEYPFSEKSSFQRLDTTPDALFYQDARLVEHVDAAAVERLTQYVTQVTQTSNAVLDVGASWTSHFVVPPLKKDHQRVVVVGLGMNAEELKANPSLTEWTVQDLNQKPTLPYSDATFDTVLCQLSIDYLTQPLKVCQEINRVLKPNGTVHILFSNRLFLSKAVALWTGADDVDHAYTVGCYLHFCGGAFANIQARDLSQRNKRKAIVGDPLYVVTAVKPKK